jgi:hypothetical protein
MFVKRDVSDRRKLVEIEVAVAAFRELELRAAQLFVLHLQFDLVDAQVVEQVAGLLKGPGRAGFIVATDLALGAFSKVLVLRRPLVVGILVVHGYGCV